jgi:hypothetical protein
VNARILLLCSLAGCAPVNRENAEIKKTAKAQAEVIQTALIQGDFGKVADLTHPKIVEAGGGKDRMVAMMAAGTKEMKEQGIEFKAMTVLEPSEPVPAGKELYIVVPFILEMSGSGQRFQTKAAIVGISGDGGKTWSFVDTTPGRDALKKVFPNLPDSLDIPKKEAPTLVEG